MKVPPIEIQWLMTEDICGVISDENREILQHHLQNPNYLSYYTLLKSRFPADNDDEMRLSAKDAASFIIAEHLRQQRKTKRLLTLAAAASLLILISIWAVFSWGPSKLIAETEADVIIRIGDDQPLDLSEPSGQFEGGSYSIRDSIFTVSGTSQGNIVAVSVPAGRKFKIRLPDSSIVQLNSLTELKYPVSFTETRDVTIKGEGFFQVKGSTSPFTVSTDSLLVKVLGTTFNVNSYRPDCIFISLVTGAVSVAASNKTVKLTAGNTLIHRKIKNQMQIVTLEPDHDLGWLNGHYSFNDYPLDSLARDIERIYGKKVTVSGNRNKRITGTIFSNSLQQSLSRLEEARLLQYKYIDSNHLQLQPW
jgi:transmembrane sensor